MKKSSFFKYVALLIFLAVFNLVFWLAVDVDNMTTVNWIAYGVIHASYLLVLFSHLLTAHHPDGRVGGFLLSNISLAFFSLQFVPGLIFIIVSGADKWLLKLEIGVFGVIFLIYLFCVFFVLFASHDNKENKAKCQAQRLAKVSVSTLKVISARTNDADVKQKIGEIIERAMSTPVSAEKAREFDMLSSKLDGAVRAADRDKALSLAEKLLALVG